MPGEPLDVGRQTQHDLGARPPLAAALVHQPKVPHRVQVARQRLRGLVVLSRGGHHRQDLEDLAQRQRLAEVEQGTCERTSPLLRPRMPACCRAENSVHMITTEQELADDRGER